ncbi:MAG: hypothetical protein V3R30_05495 [Kiloniellales bacterium]
MTVIREAAQAADSPIDVTRYPLDDDLGEGRQALVAACRHDLKSQGSFRIDGFLRPEALAACVRQVVPLMARESFHHCQAHNIYFAKEAPSLPQGHGALAPLTSSNHTLTCDQLDGTVIRQLYEWEPLCAFLADVLEKQQLYRMADPLARLNVMGYGRDEAIGWHFDRSQFTVTLLLQAPEAGGVFEYRRNLRSEDDPNYGGVARLLDGRDPEVRTLPLRPGTLNVFAGRFAAHRLTPVEGDRMRLVAILSFMEEFQVMFRPEDQLQFYGRTE